MIDSVTANLFLYWNVFDFYSWSHKFLFPPGCGVESPGELKHLEKHLKLLLWPWPPLLPGQAWFLGLRMWNLRCVFRHLMSNCVWSTAGSCLPPNFHNSETAILQLWGLKKMKKEKSRQTANGPYCVLDLLEGGQLKFPETCRTVDVVADLCCNFSNYEKRHGQAMCETPKALPMMFLPLGKVRGCVRIPNGVHIYIHIEFLLIPVIHSVCFRLFVATGRLKALIASSTGQYWTIHTQSQYYIISEMY